MIIAILYVLTFYVCAFVASCSICFIVDNVKKKNGTCRSCAYVGFFLVLWTAPLLLWVSYSPTSLCHTGILHARRMEATGVWKCFWCTHPCQDSEIVHAKTIEEVQHIVANYPQIRVIGTGHATNSLYCNGAILLSLEGMCFVDAPQVSASMTTVKVGAGCPIWYVQQHLSTHGYHLKGFGSINDQQVGGSVMTSLHGTLSFFSFSDQIQTLTAILADGNIHELSRSNDTFYAWPSSLGMLGVLVELTFEVFPIRVMQCHASTLSIEDMEDRLKDDNLVAFHANTLFPERTFRVEACTITDRDWNDHHNLFRHDDDSTQIALYETFGLSIAYMFSDVFPLLLRRVLYPDREPETTLQLTTVGRDKAFFNPFFDQEYSVPISECRATVDLLQTYAEDSKYSVIIRKVRANSFWLSWAYEKDICAIGTSFVDYGEPNAYSNHLEYRQTVEREILKRGGSVHSGKLWVSSETSFWSTEQITRFNAYRDSLDPGGKFLNSYTRQLLQQGRRDNPALPHELHTRTVVWKTFAWLALTLTIVVGAITTLCCVYRRACSGRNAPRAKVEHVTIELVNDKPKAVVRAVTVQAREREIFLLRR